MKRTHQGFSENFSYKIVALLITLILWVIILGSKDAIVTKKVAIEFLLPKNMIIVNSVPHELSFKVSGPRIALKKFSEQKEPLTIDLTSGLPGLTTIKVHPDSINVPLGIRVLALAPSTITPKLEELITKRIPVEVTVFGKPAQGFEVVSVAAEPSSFELSGARSVLEAMTKIRTEPVNVTGLGSPVVRDVPLEMDKPGLVPPNESTVHVSIVIGKPSKNRIPTARE
jgi:YbbR domain-containing protein